MLGDGLIRGTHLKLTLVVKWWLVRDLCLLMCCGAVSRHTVSTMRSVCEPSPPSLVLSIVQFLFQQLGNIISIIKQHARSYMPEIFMVVRVSCHRCLTHSQTCRVDLRLELH